MSKMGLLGRIAELFGKNITEEMANEFQDELDEFKKLIKANKGLEDMPNLEIESHTFNVPSQTLIDADFKTKIEHKKILGVFITRTLGHKKANIYTSINRQPIVADDFIPAELIERFDYLSVYESAWRLDVPIETSDVNVKYQDVGTGTFVSYDVSLHFICIK